MKVRTGAKRARPLCSDPMSHVVVRMDHVRETGLSDKPVYIQANDARVSDLLQARRQSGEPTLILEQRKSGLIS